MNKSLSIPAPALKLASWTRFGLALLPALVVMGLVSCATTPTLSSPPSIAPTVSCREHVAAEPLPVWVGRRPQLQQFATAQQYTTALEDYSAKQSQWAILAAGAYGDLAAKRGDTTDCLDKYRAAGVIH